MYCIINYIHIQGYIYNQMIRDIIHVNLYVYNAVDYTHSDTWHHISSDTIEGFVLIEQFVTYTSSDHYGMHNSCKHKWLCNQLEINVNFI